MVEIIAEVAQGYEGNITLAHLLAKGAIRAGADAIKFQLVFADELATPDYQYYGLFKQLEMPRQAWEKVVKEVRAGGKKIYFDVFGEKSLAEAIALEASGIKIHTTDFFNTRLIRLALNTIPFVYISFGGISPQELEEFLKFHQIKPGSQVCFMYGFQAEPTPIVSNNLRRFATLKSRFSGYRFGFMDHSNGSTGDAMTLALMALPFGIDCIEKHISLDRTLEIEDYISALTPEKFLHFVERVHHLEGALGSDDLNPTSIELEYRHKVLKVVVANRSLKKGETISGEVLSLKRVSKVQSSAFNCIEQVVGHIANVDISLHQQITKEMI